MLIRNFNMAETTELMNLMNTIEKIILKEIEKNPNISFSKIKKILLKEYLTLANVNDESLLFIHRILILEYQLVNRKPVYIDPNPKIDSLVTGMKNAVSRQIRKNPRSNMNGIKNIIIKTDNYLSDNPFFISMFPHIYNMVVIENNFWKVI